MSKNQQFHFFRADRFIFAAPCLLLAALWTLVGGTNLFAAETNLNAFLVFTCDGTAREQQLLHEQAATWIINQTRALSTNASRVIYRIPVGSAKVERVQLELNVVPFLLEFSGDGNHWDPMISTDGTPSSPMQFNTHGAGFSPAQQEAAQHSGQAWFRIQPAGKSPSQCLQLQHFRLDVQGTGLPPQFVRPAWWRELVPLASGPLMFAVGATSMLLVWWRWGITWRILGAGAALWAVSVALKLAFAMVASQPVARWLHAALTKFWADPLFWSYVGLLTGIFECGIFLVVASFIKRSHWSWREAVALGVGFGAIEAMALGLVSGLSMNSTGPWASLTTGSEVLVPAFERLLALIIHVASVVMILHALIARQWRWFAASFVCKSAVDTVAAWLLLSGTSLRTSPWMMEWICIAPFALISVGALFHLRRVWTDMKMASVEVSVLQN